MNLRQKLALERTRLANERTFLAYVRTALSLLAAGVVVLQYFSDSAGQIVTGWLLAVAGVVVLVLGLLRFLTVKTRLAKAEAEPDSV